MHVVTDIDPASGALPVFQFGRWWTVLTASWLHAGVLHVDRLRAGARRAEVVERVVRGGRQFQHEVGEDRVGEVGLHHRCGRRQVSTCSGMERRLCFMLFSGLLRQV